MVSIYQRAILSHSQTCVQAMGLTMAQTFSLSQTKMFQQKGINGMQIEIIPQKRVYKYVYVFDGTLAWLTGEHLRILLVLGVPLS